jgi:hypothetical protein
MSAWRPDVARLAAVRPDVDVLVVTIRVSFSRSVRVMKLL